MCIAFTGKIQLGTCSYNTLIGENKNEIKHYFIPNYLNKKMLLIIKQDLSYVGFKVFI